MPRATPIITGGGLPWWASLWQLTVSLKVMEGLEDQRTIVQAMAGKPARSLEVQRLPGAALPIVLLDVAEVENATVLTAVIIRTRKMARGLTVGSEQSKLPQSRAKRPPYWHAHSTSTIL